MRHQKGLPLLGLLTIAILTACGGGSGGDAAGGVDSSVATTDLQRNAAQNASVNLGASLGGIERVFSNAAPFADAFAADDDATGTGASAGMADSMSAVSPMVAEAESMTDGLLRASLGLDEGGASRASRSGSRVTIDPDDAAVCASIDPDLYSDSPSDADTMSERANCEALVSRVTVQIDADTEESGLITYQFDQQPLLLVGYGPNDASLDLNLGTLREVAVVAEELDGETGSIPSLVQGRVRIAATVTNLDPGQEAGTFSISIPAPIRIADDTLGIDISQAATTGFVLTADEASGTASVQIDTGALSASLNQAGSGETPLMAMLSMPGFTANLDLLNDGSRLVVSRLGLGNGPLQFSVDNVEVLSVALAPFGFTVDEFDGLIVFDADLDFALALGDFLSGFSDSNFQLNATLQGPAGTKLVGGASGSELVASGGPLSLNLRSDLDGNVETSFATWSVGGCEQSPASENSSGLMIGCD